MLIARSNYTIVADEIKTKKLEIDDKLPLLVLKNLKWFKKLNLIVEYEG